MFDSKVLIVILVIALVIFGTTRIRSMGADIGAAVKGFRQAMRDSDLPKETSLPKGVSPQKDAETPR